MSNTTIFIDESGSIPKGVVTKDNYFIITLLAVKDDDLDHVKRVFKRERLKVSKKSPELYRMLKEESEIKGSLLSEKRKAPIYQKILEKCGDKIEIAVIVLNNRRTRERFRSVTARTFNYLVKLYLEKSFREYSKFQDVNRLRFIIDERNVATKSRATLQDYLNTELNLINDFAAEDIEVQYRDSKTVNLLQLTDVISNTFYRNIQKNNAQDSEENVKLLLEYTNRKRTFIFPL